MLENFMFVLNGVVPLFVIIWLGGLLKHFNMFSPKTTAEINQLCFRLLLPCSLFNTIISTDIRKQADLRLIAFLMLSFVAAAIVLSLIVPRFIENRGQAGAVIHTSFRSNVVLLGIPLAQNLLNHEGAVLMAVAIAVSVPLFNVLGVVVLTCFSEEQDSHISLLPILRNIIKNPLIIATFSGFILSFFYVPLPVAIKKPIADLAAAATPISMLVLGAQFSFQSATKHLKQNIIASMVKLVLLPSLFTALGYAIGLRGIQLGVVFLAHSAPSAASSAMLAESMGCDGKIAGEIVLITNCLSVFTIFTGSMVLKTLGVF